MLIPLIVACALFMENLDSTVLATSLPAIAHDFGESPVRLSFAITSYLFSLAVFIPISGWVADRFGARNVFRGAIVVFLTGSILCGLSSSLWQMVAARMLQGSLEARGLLVRLGGEGPVASPRPLDDLPRVVARVRSLLSEATQAG